MRAGNARGHDRGREPRPQLYELLASLANLVDGAEAQHLVITDGAVGDGSDSTVEVLKRQVALLRAQDWGGFDWHSPASTGLLPAHTKDVRQNMSASRASSTPLELLWTSAVKLWNSCISARNKHRLALSGTETPGANNYSSAPAQGHEPSDDPLARALAWTQDCAAQLTTLVPEDQLEDGHVVQRVLFCKQAGQTWLQLGEADQAEMVLSQGSTFVPCLLDCLARADPSGSIAWEEQLALAFDLQVLHLRSLWLLGQEEAAAQLRSKCCAAALGTAEDWQLLHASCSAKLLSLQLSGTLVCVLLERADELIQQQGERQQEEEHAGAKVAHAQEAVLQGPANGAYGLLSTCHDLLEGALASGQQLQKQLSQEAEAADNMAQGQALTAQLRQCKQECLLKMMLVHVGARDGARALQCYQAAAREAPAGDGSGDGGDAATSGLLGGAMCLTLKVSALALAQRLQEAEQELVGLMAHEDAPVPLCLDVLSELLSQGASLASLKAAVQVLQDRLEASRMGRRQEAADKQQAASNGPDTASADRQDVMLAFATMAVLNARRQEAEHEALDQLLLEVMGPGTRLAALAARPNLGSRDSSAADHSANGAGTKEGMHSGDVKSSLRSACHMLLWNQAVRHFNAKRHERVITLLRVCTVYCSSDEQAGKAWRTMALSSLALRQYEEALEFLDSHLNSAGPGACSVADTFIRLKVHLQLGDEAAALQQVHAACACTDFETAILEVMCQEAQKAGAYGVAKAALVQLQAALAAADPEEEPVIGVSEGTILRLLIRITLDEAAAKLRVAPAKLDAEEEAAAPKHRGPHAELAKYCNLAANRLEAVGHEAFFGEDEAGKRAANLEWLAAMAWNGAQAAGDDQDFESCTVMLAAHARLLGMHPQPSAKQHQARRAAYTMAAGSAILVHKHRPTHASSLDLASSMISSARKARALGALASSDGNHHVALSAGAVADGGVELPMDELEACGVCQEVEVALRLQDEAEVQRLLADSLPAAAPLLSSGHLLLLAELAQRGTYENLTACQQLYRLALEQVLRGASSTCSSMGGAGGAAASSGSGAGTVDTVLAARLIRELVLLAARDDERLQRYEEALGTVSSIMCRRLTAPLAAAPGPGSQQPSQGHPAAAPGSAYPEAELRWLISSCWNHGCHHRRLSRLHAAVPYLRVAVRLLEHCPPMAAEHKAMMAEHLHKATAELDLARRLDRQLDGVFVQP